MNRVITTAASLLFVFLATPRGASATPEFAKQWGSSCASCHVSAPTGLDEEGIAFKLAGYDLELEPENPRPKLFVSFLTDVVSFSSDDSIEGPESAELFSLFRLDNAGIAKIFAIGEVAEDEAGFELDFAHGHLQVNPLGEPEQLGLRAGKVEPITRLWNTDMRRMFETPLWSGVGTTTGGLSEGGGGHHAHQLGRGL